MHAHTITWMTYAEPVTEERISSAQDTHGVRFPGNFLDIVRRWNGGRPEPAFFLYFDAQYDEWDQGSIGALLDFREPMDRYLKDIYQNDRDLWAAMDMQPWWTIEDMNVLERPGHFTLGLMAFGEDGGGNFTCFDYRAGRDKPDPPIAFWHHEFHSGGEEPYHVADNFRAFLGLLRPCLELVSEIEAAGKLINRPVQARR